MHLFTVSSRTNETYSFDRAGVVASQPDSQPGLASLRANSVPSRLRKRECASPPEQADSDAGRRPHRNAWRVAWRGLEQPEGAFRCSVAPAPRTWRNNSNREVDRCVDPTPGGCSGPQRPHLQDSEWTMRRTVHADRGSADGRWPEPRMGASQTVLESLVCHGWHATAHIALTRRSPTIRLRTIAIPNKPRKRRAPLQHNVRDYVAHGPRPDANLCWHRQQSAKL